MSSNSLKKKNKKKKIFNPLSFLASKRKMRSTFFSPFWQVKRFILGSDLPINGGSE